MLETIELFRDLTPRELEHISNITSVQTYKRGEVVFKQGEFSRDFYLIKTGQVEISVRDFLNERKILSILKSGDFFGEMALFDKDASRSATALAAQNLVLIRIPGIEFERLLNEKPTISFKLLSSLSKRLRDSNLQKIARPDPESVTSIPPKAKVITIGSARSGYGKTTFATGLANLIASELPKKVLFIDLDLYYGDGTYVLGVFSPKSIFRLAEKVKSEFKTWEELQPFIVRQSGNLYTLPAPKDFLEAEKVQAQDLIPIIKACRQFFDYIVIDTSSTISDIFLTALDLSDTVFLLVSLHDSIAIKSNSLFFHGMANLNLPEDRVKLLVAKCNDFGAVAKAQKMFKFQVIGAIPVIAEFQIEQGKTIYQASPNSVYCDLLRTIERELFHEQGLQRKSEAGFIHRLLFSADQPETGKKSALPTDMPTTAADNSLSLSADHSSSVLKYIKTNIFSGYLDQALADANRMIDISPNSSALYQMIGEIYYHQKNFSLALEASQKALLIDPNNYMALAFVSIVGSRPELMEKALSILKAKLDDRPEFPDVLTDTGRVCYLAHDLSQAEDCCLKALEKNPNYSEARVLLALVQGEAQRFDDAIRTLLQVKPKSIRVYYMLGQFFFNSGRFFNALQAFRLVHEINPSFQDTGAKLENLKDYFQKVNNLLQIHLDLKKSFPAYPGIRTKIGNIQLLLGRKDEAMAEYKEALRLNPDYSDAKKKIEDLASKPDFFVEFAPQSDTLSSLGITGQKPKFNLDIFFEKVTSDIKESPASQEFSLTIRNLRSNRSIQVPLSASVFKQGKLQADCGSLEPIFPNDMLLIQIGIKGSKEVMASLPHVVSVKELQTGKGKLDFSSPETKVWHYPFTPESPFQLPIRNFFVSLHCPDMAKGISGNNPFYKVEMKNFNTDAVATGHLDSEDTSKVDFILSSQTGKDVVREGDQLHLQVVDINGNEILTMDFPVLKEDTEEFSKSIQMDVLGLHFSPVKFPVENLKGATV